MPAEAHQKDSGENIAHPLGDARVDDHGSESAKGESSMGISFEAS